MNTTTRIQAARDAFYGSNEPMISAIEYTLGYEMNGQHYPANSLSLADVINYVKQLTNEEFALVQAGYVIPSEEKHPLSTYCCPECKGDIAIQRTPGGEQAYHCQNVKCQKVIMFGCEDALATVEGVFYEKAA